MIDEDDVFEPFHRADGSMICDGCGKRYDRHKMDGPDGWQGKFLRRLCSGELVKT